MFVAVRLSADMSAELEAFLEPRRGSGGVRWTPPDQFHVTLAFAAAVPAHRVDGVLEALSEVADRTAPFVLTVGGAGAFPTPYAAKVLWLRADSDPLADVAGLARRSRTAFARCGIAVQGGDFVPHLTVARSRAPIEATRLVRVLDAAPSLRWLVEDVVLVESRLGERPAGRARHTDIASFPLTGPLTGPLKQTDSNN